MNRFGMFGKLVAKPGQRDALVEVLLEAANLLGQAPECELYIVNIVHDEPDVIWVTELWATEEAHLASLTNADVKALVQRGRPLIDDMPQQVRLTPVGGKGIGGTR